MDPAPESLAPQAPPPKRERIIEAAAAVFLEKGYHVARIDEIAERAGVGKGTIYSYFASKAELVEALIETTIRSHLRALRERLAQVRGALAQLHAMMEFDVVHLKDQQELAQLLTSGEALGLTPDFRARIDELLSEVKALVAGLIRQGQEEGVFRPALDPETVASTVMGMRFGIVHDWLGARTDRSIEDIYRTGLEILLRGIT